MCERCGNCGCALPGRHSISSFDGTADLPLTCRAGLCVPASVNDPQAFCTNQQQAAQGQPLAHSRKLLLVSANLQVCSTYKPALLYLADSPHGKDKHGSTLCAYLVSHMLSALQGLAATRFGLHLSILALPLPATWWRRGFLLKPKPQPSCICIAWHLHGRCSLPTTLTLQFGEEDADERFLQVQDGSADRQEAFSVHAMPQPHRARAERKFTSYFKKRALREDTEGLMEIARVRKAPRYLRVSSYARLEEQ